MERSDKAGRVLAAALMAKVQGERPVSLVGYSLGARVIYVCLQELAAKQAFGLVDGVVLMGAPVPSDEMAWRRIRAVVAGRVVNVYTTNDLLLGFVYRGTKAQVGVAGLQAIDEVPDLESVDATAFVKGHHQWRWAVGRALREASWGDLDFTAVEDEEDELRQVDEKEVLVYRHAKEEGRLVDREDDAGRIVMVDAEKGEKESRNEKTRSEQSAARQPPSIDQGVEDLHLHAKPQRVAGKTGVEEDLSHSDDDEDEDHDHKPLAMVDLDPAPESESESEGHGDAGPPRETLRLSGPGGPHRTLQWDHE